MSPPGLQGPGFETFHRIYARHAHPSSCAAVIISRQWPQSKFKRRGTGKSRRPPGRRRESEKIAKLGKLAAKIDKHDLSLCVCAHSVLFGYRSWPYLTLAVEFSD